MRTIVSLEFEHKKWSWGYTSQFLLSELDGFKIISMEFKEWSSKKRDFDGKEVCFLSQNVTQFRELSNYRKIIARLGGNRTFEDASFERQQDYFGKMAKCYAIVAANGKLKNIAMKVNSNVYLVPNGLDLDLWTFKERSLKSDNALTIGFVGNVSTPKKMEYKGYIIVKDVCQKLRFPLREALYVKKQIPHDQMQENFYNKIDILVLLTDGEGCSNTIMECLACGVPVITTKEAGYHGEIMKHGKNIFFCEKNQKALYAQLMQLSQNRHLLKKVAIAGRMFAEEHHDIKAIAKKFKKIFLDCFEYNKVLSRERKKCLTQPKAMTPIGDIAVICVLKSGGVYSTDYVVKLKNMIDRNTTVAYEFVCLTDMDVDKGICRSIKLTQDQTGWWAKIELFKFNLLNARQIIYFDLDIVILKNIDDILSFEHSFSALYPWNEKNRRNGLCASGMMAWKNDNTVSFLFDQFDSNQIKNYPRGDQEYISEMLKRNKKTPAYFQNLFPGIYSYKRNCRKQLPENARIVCFHGRPRLHQVKEKWVEDSWE